MNPLDWLLAALLVYSTIRAAMRGLVRELFALGGLLVGCLLACWYYRNVAEFLRGLVNSEPLADFCAFLLIIAVVMVVGGAAGCGDSSHRVGDRAERAGPAGRRGVRRGSRAGAGSGAAAGSDGFSADGALGAGLKIFSLFASRVSCCILRHAATAEATTGGRSGPAQAHNAQLDQLRLVVAHCQLSQKKEPERVKRELDNLVLQMHAAGISYADAVREFKKRFLAGSPHSPSRQSV